jgi:hypothetical protein
VTCLTCARCEVWTRAPDARFDADTLITGERQSYPLRRFPIFWEWLGYQRSLGDVKVPLEQSEEVAAGRGGLVDCDEIKAAPLLDEEADQALVVQVILDGYRNLDENGIAQVGRHPFLTQVSAQRAMKVAHRPPICAVI